jgi:FkbM family methyltransferase
MKAMNQARELIVHILRALPDIRGRGFVAARLNSALLRAGADPQTVTKMRNGHLLTLDCRVFSHMHALYSGEYDDDKLLALLTFFPPGGVALDVGANIGFWTVPLAIAAERRGGSLIAAEPFSKNVEWLRQNLRLNGIRDETVTVFEFALSAEKGAARLTLREDFRTGASVGNASVSDDRTDDADLQTTEIRCETLDGIWPLLNKSRLDIVKLDIEGHEDSFLQGALATLRSYRPVILMEVNRWFYSRRGVDFDTAISSRLPEDYRIFTPRFVELGSVLECQDSDVFLIPAEKVTNIRSSVWKPASGARIRVAPDQAML